MSSKQLPMSSGDVVRDVYCVEDVLGLGGTGAVVAAVHLFTGAKVAIKCLYPEYAHNATLVQRFLREVNIASQLRSEHTLRILESGIFERDLEWEPDPPGERAGPVTQLPYFVMERLEGCDLRSLILQRERIDPLDAADYIAQACVALAEAHALGVVHRDIKPGNLFLARRPGGGEIVKLLDFGIARCMNTMTAGDQHVLTNGDGRLGTPSYMSPEQLASPNRVDARTDIWSLGVTLYRLITGVTPFRGDTHVDIAISIVNDALRPMAALRPDLPPGLDAVVRRCLEKRPDDRYPNVTELAGALAPFTPEHTLVDDCEPTEDFSIQEETCPWGRSPSQWAPPIAVGPDVMIASSTATPSC